MCRWEWVSSISFSLWWKVVRLRNKLWIKWVLLKILLGLCLHRLLHLLTRTHSRYFNKTIFQINIRFTIQVMISYQPRKSHLHLHHLSLIPNLFILCPLQTMITQSRIYNQKALKLSHHIYPICPTMANSNHSSH